MLVLGIAYRSSAQQTTRQMTALLLYDALFMNTTAVNQDRTTIEQ